MGDWDDITKLLVGANPQHFVSLFCPGAQFVAMLDKELKEEHPTYFADILIKILWGIEYVILHLEFQRRHDADMGERMWKYNFLTMDIYDCKVASFVLYLKPDSGIVEPPYIVSLPNGQMTHIFSYINVKLWEWPAEVFMQTGLEGLLPLLPLTKDGATHETVEAMLAGLKVAHKEDLYPLAYAFAALTFKKQADQEWLKRRFRMLKDVLEESWAYWEMYQDATEKVAERVTQQVTEQVTQQVTEKTLREELERIRPLLVHTIQRLFPQLVAQAEQTSQAQDNPIVLQQMMNDILSAETVEEARDVLQR